jgi:hypothetical protein
MARIMTFVSTLLDWAKTRAANGIAASTSARNKRLHFTDFLPTSHTGESLLGDG